MNMNLKKYLWLFSLYYFSGYLIGLPLLLLIDNIWHLHASDFIIMICLSASLPFLICDKFVKNEGRFFSEEEQTLFVKQSARIATLISLLPLVQHTISSTQSHIPAPNSVALIMIILFSTVLYYFVIRFSVNGTIKSLRKKYEKTQKIN